MCRTILILTMIFWSFFAHGQTYFYRDSTIWVWSKSAPSTFWRSIYGSVYEKRTDWNNFQKYYPDSCKTILPIVEKVSTVQAKKIEKKIKTVIDINDSTLIVPWHSILRDDPQPVLFPKYLFCPWRTMNHCPICYDRLFSIEIHVPFGLISEGSCDIDIHHYPHLLYCGECNKQVGIVKGEEFSFKTLVAQPVPKKIVGFWRCYAWPHTYKVGYEDRIIMEITEEGILKLWSEETYWKPTYEFSPQAMWMNSRLEPLSTNYLVINDNIMFTLYQGGILINSIVQKNGHKLILSDLYEIGYSSDSYNLLSPARYKNARYNQKYEYKKIASPYKVFPSLQIGKFPNEKTLEDPLFWNHIDGVIYLSDEELPNVQRKILDSLHIAIHQRPIKVRQHSCIDEGTLYDVLKLISRIDKDGRQALILCNSDSNNLSKLVGECYHFLQTGELLDFGEILINGSKVSGSLIDYYHLAKTLSSVKFKSLSQ